MSKLVFNRNDGSADEYGHLLALNRLLTGDIIEGFQVQANGTPNMTVVVGQGSGRISTGTYPSSYGYFVGIDTTTGTPAGESVTISTASSSNPRIDTVVAYVDLSVTASSATPNNPNNMLKLAAVAGTPAASPSAPSNSTIQSAIGASNPFIKLANVLVGTSVTQINSGNITDTRVIVRTRTDLKTADLLTNETTTSTTYTDLATTTDTVTVPVGVSGIVVVTLAALIQNNTSNAQGWMSFQASGANTVAATDANGIFDQAYTAGAQEHHSGSFTITGLTPGFTTFKAKYKVSTGTGTFQYRHITAEPK